MNVIEIAIWFLKNTLQLRRAVTAVLLGIIGPLFALLFRAFGFTPAETYDASVQLGIFSATLVLAAIAYGGGIVTYEVVGKTHATCAEVGALHRQVVGRRRAYGGDLRRRNSPNRSPLLRKRLRHRGATARYARALRGRRNLREPLRTAFG
ncbi:MAG: hypothetical protein C4340_05570, partial [Armatimonadota bacterium]